MLSRVLCHELVHHFSFDIFVFHIWYLLFYLFFFSCSKPLSYYIYYPFTIFFIKFWQVVVCVQCWKLIHNTNTNTYKNHTSYVWNKSYQLMFMTNSFEKMYSTFLSNQFFKSKNSSLWPLNEMKKDQMMKVFINFKNQTTNAAENPF